MGEEGDWGAGESFRLRLKRKQISKLRDMKYAFYANKYLISGSATKRWADLGRVYFFFYKRDRLRSFIQRNGLSLDYKMVGCTIGAFLSFSNSIFLCSSQCFITDMNH